MTTDRETVKKILDGDSQSFRLLVQDYQKLVAHVVFRMISNQADREEIAQEVFLKVYQNLSKFEFNSKLSTWIAKIAYNLSLNFLQKKKVTLLDDVKNQNTDSGNGKLNSAIETVYDESDLPDTFTMVNQRNEILNEAIKKLPIQQKTIVTLYHLDEMSYKEIAEIMDLPEGTVKSYLFRARKSLKEQLLKEYQLEEIYK